MTTTSSAEVQTARTSGRPDHGAAAALLSELFARHGATVLGLCRVLLRHHEEAEDAVQATFLAAYRSLLQGTEPRHPAAWLAAIARNECVARVTQRMSEPLADREPGSTLPDPVAAAAANANLAQLWRAIGELPRQQREALLLREFSGLSYVELAGALAVSEPAVESLLFRARRSLRARLQLAHGSITGVAPLVVIREGLARAIVGLPDPSGAGVFANVVSTPLAAKLAAGTAAIVVAGGTVAVVKRDSGTAPESAAPAAEIAKASPSGTPHAHAAHHTVSARSKAARAIPTPAPAPARRPLTAARAATSSNVGQVVGGSTGKAAPTPPSVSISQPPPAAAPASFPPEPDDGSDTSSASGGSGSAAPGDNQDEEAAADPGGGGGSSGEHETGAGSSGSSDRGSDSSATDSRSGEDASGSGHDGSGHDGTGGGGDDGEGGGSGPG